MIESNVVVEKLRVGQIDKLNKSLMQSKFDQNLILQVQIT